MALQDLIKNSVKDTVEAHCNISDKRIFECNINKIYQCIENLSIVELNDIELTNKFLDDIELTLSTIEYKNHIEKNIKNDARKLLAHVYVNYVLMTVPKKISVAHIEKLMTEDDAIEVIIGLGYRRKIIEDLIK